MTPQAEKAWQEAERIANRFQGIVCDHDKLVAAIAKALETAWQQATEEAAKLADSYQTSCCKNRLEVCDDCGAIEAAGSAIAAAIRQLKGEG